MSNRKGLVTTLLLLAAVHVTGGQVLAAPGDPNVIIIIADDIGVEVLSCYGEDQFAPLERPVTPNLCGRLYNTPGDPGADAGVLFRNAYANPLCTPTRPTIQTGRYIFRTGVSTSQSLKDECFIPEILNDYSNIEGNPDIAHAAIGKWNLISNITCGPDCSGYHHYSGAGGNFAFTGPPTYSSFTKSVNGRDCPAPFEAYATTDEVEDAIDWMLEVPDPGHCCQGDPCGSPACGSPDLNYCEPAPTEGDCGWVNPCGDPANPCTMRDSPWFLYIAFHAPHSPFHDPPACLYTSPITADPNDSDPDVAKLGKTQQYNAMVEAMDTAIGRLLDVLEEAGELGNTTIIFVGDNGTAVAISTWPPGHAKSSPYEGGINVPLIVSGKGVQNGGRVSNVLVNTTDLFATTLELLGVAVPTKCDDADVAHDAFSLVHVLAGAATSSGRNYAFAEGTAQGEAMRDEQYKLHPPSRAGAKCYDLLAPDGDAELNAIDLTVDTGDCRERARCAKLYFDLNELVAEEDESCEKIGETCAPQGNPCCFGVCIANVCVECDVEGDCFAGFRCDTSTNECVACKVASENVDCCTDAPKCDPDTNQCVECLVEEGDCDNDDLCDTDTNQCIRCVGSCPTGEYCDTSSHKCVECLADSECSSGLCHPSDHFCIECLSGADCPAAGGPSSEQVCDSSIQQCVECVADVNCPHPGGVSWRAACDTSTNLCVECVDSEDCPWPGGPLSEDVCWESAQVCVECLVNGDCTSDPSEPRCDTSSNLCVECLYDFQCGVNHLCCSGSCESWECCDHSDCGSLPACDSSTHTCVLCTNDKQCGPGRICCGPSWGCWQGTQCPF